jgi:hypothetical protein
MKNESLTERILFLDDESDTSPDDTSEDLEEGSTDGDGGGRRPPMEGGDGGGRRPPMEDGDSTEYGYQTDTDSTSTEYGYQTDTDSTSTEYGYQTDTDSTSTEYGYQTDTDSTSTEYGYQTDTDSTSTDTDSTSTDTDSTSTDTDSISNETTASVFSQAGTYTLDVIVELFGQVTYLKELTETITVSEDGEVISHTVDYNGTTFNWSEIDAFVLTVTRDGNFTDEFAQEIADAYPTVAGISYSTAVLLVGTEIDDIILGIAGADGNITG